jgi:hypothetical protein
LYQGHQGKKEVTPIMAVAQKGDVSGTPRPFWECTEINFIEKYLFHEE